MADKPTSNIVRDILIRRKQFGVFTAIVHGDLGVGKSMFGIKTAHALYTALGYDTDTSWQLALDSIVFKPSELGNILSTKPEIIIMDDASVHIGSNLLRIDQQMYNAFKDISATLRTATNCMLYTCPHPSGLAKFIRDSDAYRIEITRSDGHYGRLATVRKRKYITRGNNTKIFFKREYGINFTAYIPKKYYKQYIAKRESYLDAPINALLGNKDKEC